MAGTERDHDIVLFGATGFVGRLTAHHLAAHAPEGVRIALAGRSPERLAAVRAGLPGTAAHWPLVTADALDPRAMARLAARTRVVCTTVGPYATYGMPLAAACARAGTHYCDLAGEVLFVRASIDGNHAAASASGARIVHACGFDTVPSDIGVLLTARTAAAAGDGTLGEALLHVRSLRGGVSGGTLDALRTQAAAVGRDPALRGIVADPYALSPDRPAEPAARAPVPRAGGPAHRLARRAPVRLDATTRRWVAPFVMAPFNTRIVRRSNALANWAYGRELCYDEVVDTGAGPLGALRAGATALAIGGFLAGMSFGPSRRLLDRMLPKPGQGPSPEAQANGRFVLEIEARATTGARYRTRIAAPYDPGYSGTAIMLGQSALALAVDPPAVRQRGGGVLTPATALGLPLADRLRRFAFAFDVAADAASEPGDWPPPP